MSNNFCSAEFHSFPMVYLSRQGPHFPSLNLEPLIAFFQVNIETRQAELKREEGWIIPCDNHAWQQLSYIISYLYFVKSEFRGLEKMEITTLCIGNKAFWAVMQSKPYIFLFSQLFMLLLYFQKKKETIHSILIPFLVTSLYWSLKTEI